MARASRYGESMPFIQQPEKKPGVLEQAGSSIAESALGKASSAGMDKLGTWWGGLGKSAATAGPKAFVSKATPGVMAKLGAASAAATPWILPALFGAKMFGLFNKGGAVHANMGGLLDMDMGKFKGPLASMLLPQYKEHGGMMTGPLSNNKSVKMEKKETIEYKN